MKTATDISQSKLLAEFLPIESADMMWTYDFTINDINGLNVISATFKPEDNDIPAWSLGALLEIIRKNQPNYESALFVGKNDKYEYFMGYICQTKACDDPIDACVAIVRWLHENNLL